MIIYNFFMFRFFPAALISLVLWAVIVQSAQMAYVTMSQFFETIDGLLSIALF